MNAGWIAVITGVFTVLAKWLGWKKESAAVKSATQEVKNREEEIKAVEKKTEEIKEEVKEGNIDEINKSFDWKPND